MGIREKLYENPRLTNGLTIGIILIALVFIFLQIGTHQKPVTPAPRLFFTTDDGKTWFADEAQKLPPFDVDGKPAVRAYVYSCDPQKKQPFVAYLERLAPDMRDKIANEIQHSDGGVLSPEAGFEMSNATEVKRPGDANWVKRSSAAGEVIQDVKCPAETNGEPRLVSPGD